MRQTSPSSQRGFSLAEVLVAMGLGVLVMGGAVQLFQKGLNGTFIVSQRAQMQQDVRAAQDLLVKDLSLAGAGLPAGGVAVVSGTGSNPRYGCDQGSCYLPGGSSGAAGVPFTGNYLYWVVPGLGLGPTITASQGATDVITVVYADTVFLLNKYNVAFANNATQVTFTVPTPAPPTLPQAVNDTVVGLQIGDLVLFQKPGMAVGEVTSAVTAAAPSYTVSFGNLDNSYFNQTAAATGDMKQIVPTLQTTATRIWVVTYYLKIVPSPTGQGAGTPTLMRKVNGQPPEPLAENIVDLRFSYDTYDNNGNLLVDQPDAGASQSPPVSPNMIRKINIRHLTARSPIQGRQGFQSMDIVTEVSSRNMSFRNRYQ